MQQHNRELDPNHAQKRANLSGLGVILLVIGLPCLLIGFISFISVFFTSSRDFFNSPHDVMDSNARRAVIGMILMIGGGFASSIGMSLLGFAHRGKIVRYQAGEIMPVVKDAAQDVAPVATDLVRQTMQAARQGMTSSTAGQTCPACATRNDADDKFCKGCGKPLANLFCRKCGAPNDADAHFCDKCGTAIASPSA